MSVVANIKFNDSYLHNLERISRECKIELFYPTFYLRSRNGNELKCKLQKRNEYHLCCVSDIN